MEDTPTDFFSSRFLIPPPRTPTGPGGGGGCADGYIYTYSIQCSVLPDYMVSTVHTPRATPRLPIFACWNLGMLELCSCESLARATACWRRRECMSTFHLKKIRLGCLFFNLDF